MDTGIAACFRPQSEQREGRFWGQIGASEPQRCPPSLLPLALPVDVGGVASRGSVDEALAALSKAPLAWGLLGEALLTGEGKGGLPSCELEPAFRDDGLLVRVALLVDALNAARALRPRSERIFLVIPGTTGCPLRCRYWTINRLTVRPEQL